MSSIIPLGDPDISWQYHENAKAVDFNMLFRDLIPAGIYSGGEVSVFSTSQVTIPTHTAIYHTNGVLGAIKVTTKLSYNFTVFSGTPPADGSYILYGLFTWAETENNYPGYYIRSTGAGPVTNELIFGTITISGGVVTAVSPANRHFGVLHDVQRVLDRLTESKGWTYSQTVGTGTTDYPQYITLANSNWRIRQEITWGAISGLTTKRPDSIVYQLSWDSGTTYVNYATKTYTYTSEILTGISWS